MIVSPVLSSSLSSRSSSVNDGNSYQPLHSLSTPENLSGEAIIMNETATNTTPTNSNININLSSNNAAGANINNKNYWNYDSNIYFQWFANTGNGIYLIAHDSNNRIINGTIMGEYRWNYRVKGDNKNIKQSFYSPISIPHSNDSFSSVIPSSTSSSSSCSYSNSCDDLLTPEMKDKNSNNSNKSSTETKFNTNTNPSTTPSLLNEIDICDKIILRVSNVYESYILLFFYFILFLLDIVIY